MPRHNDFQAYDIQQAAVVSLQKEFNAAVDKARKNALRQAEEALLSGTYPSSTYRDGYDLASARRRIWELQQGAEGRYRLYGGTGSISGVSTGCELWGHYLESIGRLDTYPYGCIPRNEETIAGLIRQNGPKKMEERLRRFVRGQIKGAVARATSNIAPRK